MLAEAKLGVVDPNDALQEGNRIIADASNDYRFSRQRLERDLKLRFDPKTEEFINFWFLPQQQLELLALVQRIEDLPRGGTRNFLQVVFLINHHCQIWRSIASTRPSAHSSS